MMAWGFIGFQQDFILQEHNVLCVLATITYYLLLKAMSVHTLTVLNASLWVGSFLLTPTCARTLVTVFCLQTSEWVYNIRSILPEDSETWYLNLIPPPMGDHAPFFTDFRRNQPSTFFEHGLFALTYLIYMLPKITSILMSHLWRQVCES